MQSDTYNVNKRATHPNSTFLVNNSIMLEDVEGCFVEWNASSAQPSTVCKSVGENCTGRTTGARARAIEAGKTNSAVVNYPQRVLGAVLLPMWGISTSTYVHDWNTGLQTLRKLLIDSFCASYIGEARSIQSTSDGA